MNYSGFSKIGGLSGSLPVGPGHWTTLANDVYKLTVENEKKNAQRRKHCALAVVIGGTKNFRPAADPLPGGAGRPKFNQLEMVTTFTYRPSLVKIDARNFELSTHTHKQTHR